MEKIAAILSIAMVEGQATLKIEYDPRPALWRFTGATEDEVLASLNGVVAYHAKKARENPEHRDLQVVVRAIQCDLEAVLSKLVDAGAIAFAPVASA